MKLLVLLSFVFLSAATFVKSEVLPKSNVSSTRKSPTDSEEIFNILVVVDTDSLMQDYPTPSKDPSNPTRVTYDYVYLIAPKEHAISGSKTGDIDIKIKPQNTIRFYGTSENLNFESAVIVYNLNYTSNSQDASPPQKQNIAESCVFPESANIDQITQSPCNILTVDSTVYEAGKISYDVHFAVFVMTRDSDHKVLYGCFSWNPKVSVNF